MLYRELTRDKLRVSALGMGCMRLPTLESGRVDVPEAVRMIRRAIDGGVNYIDTAWPYHGGESETAVGKALADGYRDKTLVATKMPTWDVKDAADLDRIFNRQLERLGVATIDCYLLHNLNTPLWEAAKRFNMIDWAENLRRRGRIRYLGFSFHDNLNLFKTVVDAHAWDFCQIQYNYVNEYVQAGVEGLRYAAGKGLSVVVMEPLFGGALARPTGPLGDYWAASGRDPVELALRWLWNQPEIAVVLSGMSTMAQVEQNLAVAADAAPGSRAAEAAAGGAGARADHAAQSPVGCTKCGYCLPCPFGVNIPWQFELYNLSVATPKSLPLNSNLYKANQPPEARADHCTGCGACEPKCPQQLPIREHLRAAAALLGAEGGNG